MSSVPVFKGNSSNIFLIKMMAICLQWCWEIYCLYYSHSSAYDWDTRPLSDTICKYFLLLFGLSSHFLTVPLKTHKFFIVMKSSLFILSLVVASTVEVLAKESGWLLGVGRRYKGHRSWHLCGLWMSTWVGWPVALGPAAFLPGFGGLEGLWIKSTDCWCSPHLWNLSRATARWVFD